MSQVFLNPSREPPTRKTGFIYSLLVHAIAAVLVFTISYKSGVGDKRKDKVYFPDNRQILFIPIFPKQGPSGGGGGGGGGGGERAPLPPSKGKLPKFSLEQLTPPRKAENLKPKLVEDPTLIAPDIKFENPNLSQFGDLLSQIDLPSAGPGSGSGIGTGQGTGVGPGSGPGVGPGSGGGSGGGPYRPGVGVTVPILIYKVDPEFSEEARRATHQGIVELYIEVDVDGTVREKEIKVIKSLGLGLDEKAIEAVKKWKFRPGLKDGKPVITAARVTVIFRLL